MKLKLIVILLILFVSVKVSGQYVSPFKYEDGTFKSKTADEIRRESELF
jgi:hypothetical protein